MVRRGHDAKAGSIIVLSADRPWGPQIRIPELSAQAPRTRTKLESVRRRAVLRVQCRTPGQRVAKNHHVRRQLCRPCSFPLSQNLAWRCTKQCNPVPNVRLFRAPPPKSTHPQLSRSFLYPSVFSKHPNELGLVYFSPLLAPLEFCGDRLHFEFALSATPWRRNRRSGQRGQP